MKRRFLTILSAIMAFIICVSASGCNLVTKNNDRDLDRIVASVNVTKQEDITKREMIMQYMSYGYLYVNYYGYTVEQTYNSILESLIQTRIMVQYCIDKFEKDTGFDKNTNVAVGELDRYLTEDEISEVEYDAYKTINDLLDSYTDGLNEEEKSDSFIGEVRTVPTDAKNAEKEIELSDKKDYVKDIKDNGFDIKSSAERRSAYNKVVKLLEDNSLLGDFKGDLRNSDYAKRLIKGNKESKLIEKFEEEIQNSILENLTFANLEDEYDNLTEKQKEMTNSEFVSALSSATATSPILYSGYGNYGYVYNLLLGASSEITAQINKIKEEKNISDEDLADQRKDALENIQVKDLRSSWILSGYDFDGEKFTGDYTLVKDGLNSLAFNGEVREIKAKTDEENARYNVKSVNVMGLDEFIDYMDNYLETNEGTKTGTHADNKDFYSSLDLADKNIYGAKTLTGINEYDAKIQELLFAYSTDSGSLNTYKGYVIKPAVDGADSEEYVKTFGDAGRKLLESGENGYVIVASDFGYHIMFYSQKFTADLTYDNLSDYLDTLDIDKSESTWEDFFNAQKSDWKQFAEDNTYLYYLANSIVSNKISAEKTSIQNNIINKYRYEQEDCVKIYSEVYSDLF